VSSQYYILPEDGGLRVSEQIVSFSPLQGGKILSSLPLQELEDKINKQWAIFLPEILKTKNYRVLNSSTGRVEKSYFKYLFKLSYEKEMVSFKII